MKKGFVLKFIPLAIIILLVGIIVLLIFLGKDGHLTGVVNKFPEFFNQVLGEIERRSPIANSAYFFASLNSAYTFAIERNSDEICFFELDNANSRMTEGYVNIVKRGDDLLLSLKTVNDEDESNLPQVVVKGNLCVIHGQIANELHHQINRQNWGRRNANRIASFFSSGTVGGLTLNSAPLNVQNINISIGSNGADQITYGVGEAKKFSNFMIYINGDMCFIPVSLHQYNECKFMSDGSISSDCLVRMKRFSCN